MTDYSEQGARPVDDAGAEEPPTVDEVIENQRRDHPEQAATSTLQPHAATGTAPTGRRPDPIEEEAADIDARSPDAPERIEQLREDAEALGRDVRQPPV